MQILFIADETEAFKFLSGMQARAIMPKDLVEVSVVEDPAATVICTGSSTHYPATIARIDSGFQTQGADMKWLGVTFIVRRVNMATDLDGEYALRND